MLFDTDRVRGTMELIFPAAAAPAGGEHARAGRSYATTDPRGTPRRGIGVRGSAAILFAMLAMGVGLAASRLLPRSVPPASAPSTAVQPVRLVAPATAPSVSAMPVVEAPPRIMLSRPPSLDSLVERETVAPPRVVALARPTIAVAPTPVVRIAAATEATAASRLVRTPHLTGAAQTRALAQDVIDTRVLNEAILRNAAASTPGDRARRD